MVTQTIPASEYVTINPSVLSAGGNAPSMSGLYLDSGNRVPIGTVQSFPSALAVSAYFGPASLQYADAQVYFAGFVNKTQTPGALLFTQYPTTAVAAWLRGGSLAAMTLAQLQAISAGTITIVVDGESFTSSSINLSTATSFSNAASIIQTALAAQDATGTGSMGASFTASGSGTTLTVTSVTGYISVGDTVSGTGVPTGTTIVAQVSGTTGGAGTYTTSGATTASSASCTTVSNVLNVTAVAAGTILAGGTLAGTGVAAGSTIVSQSSGTTGSTGNYVVSGAQQSFVSTNTLVFGAVTVTFDSISSAFVITSGSTGATSTIAFPTTNTFTSAIYLTAAAGAVTSQGSAAATPNAFMTALVNITTNFASFAPNFEPVTADKEAFAAWNSAQNNQFAFAMDTTDITITTTNDSSSALYNIIQNNYSGTIANYQPSYLHTSAFVMGMIASINFGVPNGRISLAYKSSSLLSPGVSSQTAAVNIENNGANYYGSVSNADNAWDVYFPGQITGPFKWADSYVNQIWLNQSLQTAIMTMLTQVNAVPYNQAGYDLVAAACNGPIQQALTSGVINTGVPLSAAQALEVNNAVGVNAASILSTRGWYLQVGPATPTQRNSRSSPPCTLYYTDGGSINRIDLASINVQ